MSGWNRFAAAVLLLFAGAVLHAADPRVYRLELGANQILFARTPPVVQGTRLVFSRYPDGAVVSLRRADVRRVVVMPVVMPGSGASEVRAFKPGQLIVLGPTGGGASGSGSTAAGGGATSTLQPGEAPGGTAMYNSGRNYRPEWDARQVPGQSIAYPASPGDLREGTTMAYPPGGGSQTSPGAPPTGVPTGEPPKSPQ
jgi:hypothetical protein